jgi:NADH-quinone oxidoreductase subunit K
MSNFIAAMSAFFVPENLMVNLFTAVLLCFVGIYCMAFSRNMLRTLIGIEISSKGTMLALLSAGYAMGHVNTVSAVIILMIGVEVAVIAVGLGLVIRSYGQKGNLDVMGLKNLKG